MKKLILIILLTQTIGYSANNSYVLDKKTPIPYHLISNDTIVSKTEAGKIIRDVGIVGKKVLRKIKELFAVKHKVPKNYISISPVQTYNKDSLGFFINESNLKPSLKLTYPRITPSKGYFSFQLGDYEYFKYFNELNIKNIEYIKLISEDGSECIVDKFEFVKKGSSNRHFSFLLDHSGSMGKKRASILQKSIFNAISKNIKNDSNSSYSVYKFSETTRLISKGSSIESIKSGLIPVNGLRGFGGGTAVKDALIRSITDLIKISDKDFKAIIIFTDGDSNSDIQSIPMSNVIKSANENNINIVSVAFGSYLNIDYLKDIAVYSGGDLFHIYKPDEFETLFDNIFEDVLLSYDLEFVPCFFGENIKLEMKLVSDEFDFVGETVFRTPLKKGYSIDLSIEFEINSKTIRSQHYSRLNSLVKLLKFEKKLKIIVEGHSDKLGAEKINIKLSNERALAVKNYLISKGISGERIKTIGYGSSQPAFNYENNSNINAKNRRIQIVIDN